MLQSLPRTLRQNPKNHAKEFVLLMWFRGEDKNGWQNAHGHFVSQKGD